MVAAVARNDQSTSHDGHVHPQVRRTCKGRDCPYVYINGDLASPKEFIHDIKRRTRYFEVEIMINLWCCIYIHPPSHLHKKTALR